MAAFENAIAMGADGIELDVHVTADGEVIVYHDDALKPDITRDSSGHWLSEAGPLIKDMTWAELSALDVGRAKPGSRYALDHPRVAPQDGARIPLLRDVLRLAKRHRCLLLIEMKSNFVDRSRTHSPTAFARAVTHVFADENASEIATVIGFDWVSVLEVKRRMPRVPIWLTTMPRALFAPPGSNSLQSQQAKALEQLREWEAGEAPWTAGFDRAKYGTLQRAIAAAQAEAWFPSYQDVTRDSIADARAQGLHVGAWTVNKEADMRRMIGLKIDGICTDYPDRLKSLLDAEASQPG